MASTGFTLAGTGANEDAGAGTPAWSNPGNITASDDTRATCSSISATTDWLQADNFGFSIPAGATIDGIQVRIQRHSTAFFGAHWEDHTVQLRKAGTRVGSNKADTGVDWPETDTDKDYGGATDLWGESWTVDDINHADFGVELRATHGANTIEARVDAMWINVHYTEGGGGGGVPKGTHALTGVGI